MQGPHKNQGSATRLVVREVVVLMMVVFQCTGGGIDFGSISYSGEGVVVKAVVVVVVFGVEVVVIVAVLVLEWW